MSGASNVGHAASLAARGLVSRILFPVPSPPGIRNPPDTKSPCSERIQRDCVHLSHLQDMARGDLWRYRMPHANIIRGKKNARRKRKHQTKRLQRQSQIRNSHPSTLRLPFISPLRKPRWHWFCCATSFRK